MANTSSSFDRFRFDRQGNHWQDWANLILAIWLFISPWVLQFGAGAAPAGTPPAGTNGAAMAMNTGQASWNAWVLGVIVFIVAWSAIARLSAWQEWINLLLGIWLFIAPWVLGFAGAPRASWDHWVVGALIFIIAAANLATVRSRTVTTTTGTSPGYAGNKPERPL